MMFSKATAQTVAAVLGGAKRLAKLMVYSGSVPARWSKSTNWGDALNPFLIEKLSGRPARYEEAALSWKYLVIGSILQRADRFSIVWGAGLISSECRPREVPHAIHAVRGPLTRQKLLSQGIQCPKVYGDPALLLPLFLDLPRQPKWKLGVVPHYADRMHPWILGLEGEADVRVLDICADTEEFVQQVLSCECILSSSLHGLICADAYGIPNRRMVLDGNQIIGGEFKFQDYYQSVNVEAPPPIGPQLGMRGRDVVPAIDQRAIDIDLDELLATCPFRR
jgi:pyruvyltransferase